MNWWKRFLFFAFGISLTLVSTIARADTTIVIPGMTLIPQTQSNWCWAADTQTISKFLGPEVPQCKAASKFVAGHSGESCCLPENAGKPECNQAYLLDQSLSFYRFLDKVYTTALSTADIVLQLIKRYPVAARIGWDHGGGHFLIIYGAKIGSQTETFNIWNPLPLGKGDRQIVSRSGLTRYNNAGNWTHTYTTKKPQE